MSTMRRFKVIIIGDVGTGKSTVRRTMAPDDEKITKKGAVTVGRSSTIVDLQGHKVKVVVQDTGGMERYATLPRDFFADADGVILLYDTGNADSLKNTKFWQKECMRSMSESTVYMLMGNNRTGSDRQVTKDDAHEYNDTVYGNEYLVAEVDGKSGENMKDAVQMLAQAMADASDDGERPKAINEKNKGFARKKRSGGCVLL